MHVKTDQDLGVGRCRRLAGLAATGVGPGWAWRSRVTNLLLWWSGALKKTNHYIIPKHELEEILGKSTATNLINGNVDQEAVSLLCEKLNLDRLGIFNVNDLDVIDNSIWLVQSEFYTYHTLQGFTEPIFTRGFNIDKRS